MQPLEAMSYRGRDARRLEAMATSGDQGADVAGRLRRPARPDSPLARLPRACPRIASPMRRAPLPSPRGPPPPVVMPPRTAEARVARARCSSFTARPFLDVVQAAAADVQAAAARRRRGGDCAIDPRRGRRRTDAVVSGWTPQHGTIEAPPRATRDLRSTRAPRPCARARSGLALRRTARRRRGVARRCRRRFLASIDLGGIDRAAGAAAHRRRQRRLALFAADAGGPRPRW